MLVLISASVSAIDEGWVARYNGPADASDGANAIAIDSAGNIYVTGNSQDRTNRDFTTIKYGSSGIQKWVESYDGPASSVDNAIDIALGSTGNVYVTGYSQGGGTSQDYATVAYDSAGNEASDGVSVDSQGNIVTVGGSSFNGEDYEHCTIIYDKDGNEICIKRPGINGFLNGVVVDSQDRIVVTGSIAQVATGYDYYTNRYVDVTPPAVQMIKPEENSFYMFNIKLFGPFK